MAPDNYILFSRQNLKCMIRFSSFYDLIVSYVENLISTGFPQDILSAVGAVG